MNRVILYILCALLTGPSLGIVRGEEPKPLSLSDAHEMALRNHPRIKVAELVALASHQVVKQVQSGFLPQVAANAVAVGTAGDNTRLAAIGALNNPSIFDRNAEGLMISQLITDFGRTSNLRQSAQLQALAQENNAEATREQIVLEVDGAYYAALEAQAVALVAQKTVAARQLFLDQVTALAGNKLRSELDVSFAKVNLEDAQLLQSQADNNLQAAFTQLNTLLGQREPKRYLLAQQPLPPPISTNAQEFVEVALTARPDLLRLRHEEQSALKLARASKAARLPTVSAVGSLGVVPIHDPELPDTYAAAGLTLTLPLYSGGRYLAQQREAELRAQAAAENLRDLENNVIREVRIACLNTQNAYDRLNITRELLNNARQSLDLARARYKNGLSSIVELNQAELGDLSAEIAYTGTQYEYLLQRSTLSYQTGVLR